MLVRLGPSMHEPGVRGALVACHARIRAQLALGQAVIAATGDPARAAEVADACAQIARYLREALPKHVADEDLSIAPRLRGRRADLDAALAQVEADHAAHDAWLTQWAQAALALAGDPQDEPASGAFAAALTALAGPLEAHLAHEEAVVFAALADLDAPTLAEIEAEIHARRADVRRATRE